MRLGRQLSDGTVPFLISLGPLPDLAHRERKRIPQVVVSRHRLLHHIVHATTYSSLDLPSIMHWPKPAAAARSPPGPAFSVLKVKLGAPPIRGRWWGLPKYIHSVVGDSRRNRFREEKTSPLREWSVRITLHRTFC